MTVETPGTKQALYPQLGMVAPSTPVLSMLSMAQTATNNPNDMQDNFSVSQISCSRVCFTVNHECRALRAMEISPCKKDWNQRSERLCVGLTLPDDMVV